MSDEDPGVLTQGASGNAENAWTQTFSIHRCRLAADRTHQAAAAEHAPGGRVPGLQLLDGAGLRAAGTHPRGRHAALRPRPGDRQRKTLRRVLVDRADLDAFIESRKRRDGGVIELSADAGASAAAAVI